MVQEKKQPKFFSQLERTIDDKPVLNKLQLQEYKYMTSSIQTVPPRKLHYKASTKSSRAHRLRSNTVKSKKLQAEQGCKRGKKKHCKANTEISTSSSRFQTQYLLNPNKKVWVYHY